MIRTTYKHTYYLYICAHDVYLVVLDAAAPEAALRLGQVDLELGLEAASPKHRTAWLTPEINITMTTYNFLIHLYYQPFLVTISLTL